MSPFLDNENGGVIASLASERLDKLREEIYRLERELAGFGYDPRRGIESYSVSELRELIERAGPKRPFLEESLIRLIDAQTELYKELYRLAGFKELDVDTEIPEKNLMRLKEWISTGGAAPGFGAPTKFEQALKEIAEVLRSRQEGYGDGALRVLRRVYKRDYDRYRAMKRILGICAELGCYDKRMDDLEMLPLGIAAKLLDDCVRKVGPLRLAERLESMEGGRRK
jgi:hypothetical protein